MRASDPAPNGDDDDEPDWDLALDEEFVRAATIREDALHARHDPHPLYARHAGPPEPGPRAGRRRLVLGASALVLAAVGAGLLYGPASRAPDPGPTIGPGPTVGPEVTAGRIPPLALPPDWVAPLDAVFPERSADPDGPALVRLRAADLPSCTDPAVPAREGEAARRAGRCVAAQHAVYAVGEDRLTVSVLTMASAEEARAAVSALGAAPATEPPAPAARAPLSVGRADRTVWLYSFTGTGPAPSTSRLVAPFMAHWTARAEQAAANGPAPAH
ncbi:hypothetical protein [Kitasatospora sp. NPDC088134]|uniref:hypothetical protein n=1 Tax=Kitasatospora sp. NPDC088134 TaxID=3364071 RepID=UPI0037FF9954